MPIRTLRRGSAVQGTATPTAAPIYVDSDDNIVKVIPAGSGTTEVQVVDVSSTQTITGNKTFTGTVVMSGAVTKTEFADGTVSLPSITFSDDLNSGIYRIGADNIGVATAGANVLDIAATTITVPDDILLRVGTTGDGVLVNRSTALNANTALTSVFIGTPVVQALAANSLVISNVTASGDIVLAAARGTASEEYLFIDASAGKLTLTSPADNLVLKAQAAGKKVIINSFTSTDTANSIMGFQAKPGCGASTANNVIGGEISPRINDTFALTGSGSLTGLHVDTYLKGTTGNIAGNIRTLELEAVTDDAGTRTLTGDLSFVRCRAAWSGTINGHFVPFLVEKAEVQTNSQQYDALFKLTGVSAGVWNDDPATELNNPGGTVKGYIKVIVNGNARYIALYEAGNLAD